MKAQIPKEMVFTYLSGNATVLQKELIKEWLLSPENVETYFEWIQEWETNQPQFLPDPGNAFSKFSQRVLEKETETPTLTDHAVAQSRVPRFLYKLKWVAMVVFLLSVSGYQLRDSILYKVYTTAYGQTKTITLADNSLVSLNANSNLRVPRWGFGGVTRNVVLDGEARFSVVHTADDKQFVVSTTEGKVTVLGTEFLVYSRNRETNVVLRKGKVQLVSTTNPEPRDMSPGDKATVTNTGAIEIMRLATTDTEVSHSWKQHKFTFLHTPLKKVTQDMQAVFGVEMIIDDSELASRELTGTFRAQNPDELLKVLAEMMDMRITLRDNVVHLLPNQY
jgi:transmembrane sensor